MNFPTMGDSSSGEMACASAKSLLVNPTLTQSLEVRKERLESELNAVNEALAALKAMPDIERLLNLIQKIR